MLCLAIRLIKSFLNQNKECEKNAKPDKPRRSREDSGKDSGQLRAGEIPTDKGAEPGIGDQADSRSRGGEQRPIRERVSDERGDDDRERPELLDEPVSPQTAHRLICIRCINYT